MAIGERQLERRLSNLTIFATSILVAAAVAVLAWQPDPDTASMALNTGTTGPTPVSQQCREADRAAVADLARFLGRNGSTDAPVLERAVHMLNLARRHCFYDWNGRGLDDYQWLRRWLGEHSWDSGER
ncbi:MAG: hypothetical protein J0J01_06185 [Reyranella sp.]|uniref:hypothetical protein n=1 Tax=Reyranella sp. TaxID=1929291 RepID=UPI001ACF8FD0|nr:hypothetical protein [Reyranella sp.]MBN9086479.1 hypothetical protein [Reyranella sp.]